MNNEAAESQRALTPSAELSWNCCQILESQISNLSRH